MDRVCDVTRYFPLTLDLGCGRSHVAMATSSDVTGCLVQCDMAENALVSVHFGGGCYNLVIKFFTYISQTKFHTQPKKLSHFRPPPPPPVVYQWKVWRWTRNTHCLSQTIHLTSSRPASGLHTVSQYILELMLILLQSSLGQ